jgi:hypothetical protein
MTEASRRVQPERAAVRASRRPARAHATRLLLALIAVFAVTAATAETAVERARYFFNHRHLAPGHELEARRILADYRFSLPLDTAALALWCQVNEDLGDGAHDKAEKDRYYRVAEVAADTLRTMFPDNATGHFWWAAAHGNRALARGIAAAVIAAPSVISELKRAITLDPSFPLPYAVLGVLYRDLPGVAGGSRARARSYLVAGLKQAPNLTLLRLELARLDAMERKYGDAREQLKTILRTERPYFETAFVVNDRPQAESLLAKIHGK